MPRTPAPKTHITNTTPPTNHRTPQVDGFGSRLCPFWRRREPGITGRIMTEQAGVKIRISGTEMRFIRIERAEAALGVRSRRDVRERLPIMFARRLVRE